MTNIYTFSISKIVRFIINHLWKVFIVGAILILLVGILNIVRSETLILSRLTPYIYVVTFLSLIVFIFERIFRKFAQKIIIDFDTHKLQLHMNRSNEIIKVDFDDIKELRVNGYIIFIFKEKKVFFNDLQNKELFSSLNKIKRIHWGVLCSIWGPSKDMRDMIEEASNERKQRDGY